ncbi:MAG TPA: Gfo/Idh/MocA family oxidoreductase [Longimicrobiales bacterium]|nr:Gfo/Idh/MocA family oxidoreductase [Longimicrobiales bacterium]
MSEGSINVALIGYAFMGRAHSNAYRQVNAFFSPRLTARRKLLCGRSEGPLGEAAARFGWEQTCTDWHEAIERDDIDLVDICTPGDSHAEIAIAAVAAGKAVLCEKPLANSVADAEAMLAAAERARVVNMVCHNYRRAPAVLLAERLIAAGRIGTIHHFRGTYLQDWLLDPAFPLVWRLDRARAGSGALGDLGAHVIDLAHFLVGEIAEVAGALRTFVAERPMPGDAGRHGRVTVDDAAVALVRFAGGALGTIEATRFAAGRHNYNRFEINGSGGSIAFNLERMNELEVYFEDDADDVRGFRTIDVTQPGHPFAAHWWPSGHAIGYEHTFTHTIYDLLEGIAADVNPRPGFADGLRTQRVLDAIARAHASRRWEQP